MMSEELQVWWLDPKDNIWRPVWLWLTVVSFGSDMERNKK
jgi:hypothetical protein